ncbi:hypothetical protein [Halobacillus sp. A5]|uniref:hypothetical protein n=1 Tax=Halobacillus sp. A5 TaxID=2880263 RepID=UPI0020A6C20F|nr:hypothetical protein [Halobacillus sp. A5]MCP3027746.1 hypothetical protein [Halobacillus sp. A5]
MLRIFKSIVLLTLLVLSALGCNQNSDLSGTFEEEDISEDLEELSFKPQLPTSLPFEPESVQSEAIIMSEERLSINMVKGKDETEGLNISIMHASLGSPERGSEEVNLDNEITGYYKKSQNSSSLTWEEENTTYMIQHTTDGEDKLLGADALTSIAKGFE